ncbi:dihydropteroate synthase [Litorilinea aerophila]|nr:dihydropteroate synthase [Litorilinea aerophila]MCC9078986.1 dihydropteroate synthase [Litorilinea aerophila]
MVQSQTQSHTAYIAMGSNLGPRAAHLHAALQAMASFAVVEDTSFLYETPPAYVTDQPDFLNAVCRIRTDLAPAELLAALKSVERRLGRTETVRFGPRVIDLDILFYDDLCLDEEELTLPHPRLAERDFVLRPLCDLVPDLRHPRLQATVQELLQALPPPDMHRVTPVGEQLWRWGEKTYVMGILNATPDSFSGDGLLQDPDPVARAVAQARHFVDAGAHCLDVGGQSTRPQHPVISEEEELARVIPVIQALAGEVPVPISVDTFRASVAKAALGAGASLINDVWGTLLDPAMATVAAQANVPLVVMHNRMPNPDPTYRPVAAQMEAAYRYQDVASDVWSDLDAILARARRAGVPRWHLIVDPGIGFGKTVGQQLALIRRLDELTARGYPLLFGPSRKSFIGKVLGDVPPEERLEGTLATCVLAIDRGADILRVHDVQAVARAARMTDAVVRPAAWQAWS